MNYIELALRTNSTVTGQNANVTPDLLHATLGLADELFEYNMAKSWLNAVEELGDMCWFIALASHDLDCDPFDLDPLEPSSIPVLAEAVADFVGSVKKSYAYGKPVEYTVLRFLLHVMVTRIRLIAESKGERSLEELLAANIAKLRARYPEKFEVDLALVRNIKQEASAMRSELQ